MFPVCQALFTSDQYITQNYSLSTYEAAAALLGDMTMN